MKIIRASRGSGMDLQNAIEDKIAQLNNDGVMSASNIDDTTRERYLHNLIGDVEASLKENGIQNLSFDQDDRNLYVTVGDTLEEYQVPFKDLSFDFHNIDKDERYIVDEIVSSCQSKNKKNVSASEEDDYELEQMKKEQAYKTVEKVRAELKNEIGPEDEFFADDEEDYIHVYVRYSRTEEEWEFYYDELGIPSSDSNVIDSAAAYICNTVIAWLDDPSVTEDLDDIEDEWEGYEEEEY